MVAQKIFRSLAIFLNDKVFEQKRNVKNQHRDSWQIELATSGDKTLSNCDLNVEWQKLKLFFSEDAKQNGMDHQETKILLSPIE